MGETVMRDLKEKGGDESYMLAFIIPPFASDDELPRICVLERTFTDQAMSFTLFSHTEQR
jgi:hypothetical protein